jgi:hypothetical protein
VNITLRGGPLDGVVFADASIPPPEIRVPTGELTSATARDAVYRPTSLYEGGNAVYTYTGDEPWPSTVD